MRGLLIGWLLLLGFFLVFSYLSLSALILVVHYWVDASDVLLTFLQVRSVGFAVFDYEDMLICVVTLYFCVTVLI